MNRLNTSKSNTVTIWRSNIGHVLKYSINGWLIWLFYHKNESRFDNWYYSNKAFCADWFEVVYIKPICVEEILSSFFLDKYNVDRNSLDIISYYCIKLTSSFIGFYLLSGIFFGFHLLERWSIFMDYHWFALQYLQLVYILRVQLIV